MADASSLEKKYGFPPFLKDALRTRRRCRTFAGHRKCAQHAQRAFARAIRPAQIAAHRWLPNAGAATWLDRELASDASPPIRDAGFGREVRGALATRRQWLVEQDLADDVGERVQLRANAIAVLQRRELLRLAEELSDELGKPFVEARSGEAMEGTLRRRVDLVSGRFALVEKGPGFSLVPWRPVLEGQLGRQVGGIMRSDGLNWQIARGRGGPDTS